MHDRHLDAEPIETAGVRCGEQGVEGYYKYILIKDIELWEANGWAIVDDLRGTHHGYHAVLGKWAGTGEPIMPRE